MAGIEIVWVVALALVLLKYMEASLIGVSVSCMMAYDEGGAPAVLESNECLQWTKSLPNKTANCQFYQLQGHREYQEDRISCDLLLKIPLLGKNELKEVKVGVIGVFDGHGGQEASEMASNSLTYYFNLHSVFKMYKLMVQYKGELTVAETESLQMEVVKEALLSTIRDIDTKFTREALENKLLSGSTATVVIMFNGQFLVANLGDSKALLFSEKFESSQGPQAFLSAIELTKDHHPDREDERVRIEAAGGSVIILGVPRVNGILAMSRSIGDVYLKRYGVIAEPELTGWRQLTADDKYLLVASDGIFESLTPNNVRDLILEWESHQQGLSFSLAEYIVHTAYQKGSTDNLSAIVISV